jgi:hypothetical protein
MLLGALSLLLVSLLALLIFKDYKTRSRMKLSENIPGPKALPLVGDLWDLGFNIDSKLHVFILYKVPTRCNFSRMFISHCKITLYILILFCCTLLPLV